MTTTTASGGFGEFPKGSEWRRWDLQTATIIDDDYVPLKTYAEALKSAKPSEWQEYITKVGGEANALLYDSATYFNDSSIAKKDRCTNYVRNLFAFVDVFSPDLACLGLTD